MDVRRFLAACVFTGAALSAAGSAPAGGLDDFIGVWDAPSRYFPGKYFEQKAQFYLKKQDYVTALRLFELSGYWADKVAQYNAGIMYFNGIGVPTDKVLGTAWLGIAAEAHDSLADQALQLAFAELTPEQRSQAEAAFRVLDEKYGDDVALERALKRYQQDAAISLFGFGVTGPGYVNTCAGGAGCTDENSVSFVHRMEAQRSALIAQITGHVSVGGVQPLEVPAEAKQHASQKVLLPPSGEP
jgi:hypothetical protein